MTPKIKLDLSESGCRKPGCKHAFKGPPHRHHTRHEKTWINLWDRIGPPPYKGDQAKGIRLFRLLKSRYHQFRPQDTVRICDYHHVEIHEIYRRIIRSAEWKFRKARSAFSFEEALWVMRMNKEACEAWLQKKSSGMNPRRAGWGKKG